MNAILSVCSDDRKNFRYRTACVLAITISRWKSLPVLLTDCSSEAGIAHLPFCSNCGGQVDSSLSFCTNCGASLKGVRLATTQESAQVSMKEKGGELEDAIAGYFRSKGYDVQVRTKMRDRRDVFHEIDVLATKREDFGNIQVAVECKHVRSPIDIKELRNFNDKLSALGLTKGIFVSTGGFTTDAESHAASVNIELWDEKALEEKISRQETPEKDILHDAFPFRLDSIPTLRPKHLRNFNILSESGRTLNYRPFYFLEYHCFSQHTVRGDSVILESKGTVVVDGVSGQVVDSRTTVGIEPELPKNGAYVGCIGLQPQTITSTTLPNGLQLSVLPPKIDSTRAKDIAKLELVKSLSYYQKYETTRTSGIKTLNPRKKDIEILSVQPIKIPLLTGTFRLRNYTYTRTCLASTCGFVLDQTSNCLLCTNRPVVVCGNCGAIVCESHMRTCSVCSITICTSCVVSKGIISKTLYCPEHKPIK